MGVNVLTRDQILIQALDMADLPELNQHDRPAGTIDAAAFTINWLQRAVDEVLAEFPWGGQVADTPLTLTGANTLNVAPTDMLKEVREGVQLQITSNSVKSLIKRNFQDIIRFQAKNNVSGSTPPTGQPVFYCFTGRTLRIDKVPDQNYTGTLWFYQRQAALSGSTVPLIPSDHALVDFVFHRALEYGRKIPPGYAMKVLREVEIPAIRTSDLGQEPESDHIELDRTQFRGSARRATWNTWGVNLQS